LVWGLGAVFALVTTLFFTHFPASEAKFRDRLHNLFFALHFFCRTDDVEKSRELSQFICERSARLTTFFDQGPARKRVHHFFLIEFPRTTLFREIRIRIKCCSAKASQVNTQFLYRTDGRYILLSTPLFRKNTILCLTGLLQN